MGILRVFLVGKAILGGGIYAVFARATLMIACSCLYADSDAELLNNVCSIGFSVYAFMLNA